MRVCLLAVALLPYVYFGLNDNLLHLRHRPVCRTERLLHAAIVMALATVIPQAFFGSRPLLLGGLVLFLLARCLDEYVFHRNLPGAEADLHAKTHLAFLLFLVAVLLADRLQEAG